MRLNLGVFLIFLCFFPSLPCIYIYNICNINIVSYINMLIYIYQGVSRGRRMAMHVSMYVVTWLFLEIFFVFSTEKGKKGRRRF